MQLLTPHPRLLSPADRQCTMGRISDAFDQESLNDERQEM